VPTDVSVQGEYTGPDPDAIVADADALLGLLDRPSAELSVMLCDDAVIQPLNAQWRGVDQATDVLSFPQDDALVLGDVVISAQTAARQAAEHGHGVEAEVRVLLVHGLLHLLGHDHQTADEAVAMNSEEARLLAALDGALADGLVGRNRER